MKTVREIQELSGDLWPDIDENFNEIRRQCAAQLQAQEQTHAAAMASLEEAHARELQDRDSAISEISATAQSLENLRLTMTAKVRSVLASGDPEQFAALAEEFLTPENEKRKAELEAEIAAKKAELEQLNS